MQVMLELTLDKIPVTFLISEILFNVLLKVIGVEKSTNCRNSCCKYTSVSEDCYLIDRNKAYPLTTVVVIYAHLCMNVLEIFI